MFDYEKKTTGHALFMNFVKIGKDHPSVGALFS